MYMTMVVYNENSDYTTWYNKYGYIVQYKNHEGMTIFKALHKPTKITGVFNTLEAAKVFIIDIHIQYCMAMWDAEIDDRSEQLQNPSIYNFIN